MHCLINLLSFAQTGYCSHGVKTRSIVLHVFELRWIFFHNFMLFFTKGRFSVCVYVGVSCILACLGPIWIKVWRGQTYTGANGRKFHVS